MDLLPLSDFAKAGAIQMLLSWAVGTSVSKLKPNSEIVWDKIELGRKVLSFIGEAPEWVNYDQHLEGNIESLKSEMETLRCVEEDVCHEVEMLELRNNTKRKREVEDWLKNVKRSKQDVEDVEREMGQKGKFSRFLFRAWLGSCVEKKKRELGKLLDQKRAFEPQLVLNAQRVGQESLFVCELMGEVGNKRKEEIWGKLTDQGVNILGVEGDEGMGKSITMMHIYNLVLDDTELFDCAFYVTLKGEDNVYRLQTAIGRELKLSDLEEEEDEIRRAARIYRALKLARRFVLVLDGLVSPFRLHDVGIPLEKDGGKLVVVSQVKRVCQKMLCKPVIGIGALASEDASKLFMETLNLSGDLCPETKAIAEEIIRRCNGVPRRIIEASESLRIEDDISTWRTKLSEL